VTLAESRVLHAYDAGGSADDLPVMWLHGTPNIGAPPAPLFESAARLGLRWVSYDRPGYGGSAARPGRNFASAVADVARVAEALDVERLAVMGHSSGGPHALACGALLPERVTAVVSVSGLAPYSADDLDWFAGMAPPAAASLRAAAEGREAKERYVASAPEEDPGFVVADHEALAGDWGWFLDVVRPAIAAGPTGLIDDDLANVAEWGFDAASVAAPVLIQHGEADRMIPIGHAEWLARRCPTAELRRYPGDGHVSVMRHAVDALEWLRARADQA